MSDFIKRGTGLLLIDVKDSNPNGDPDRDSDPRMRQDGRGEISPVSFKRKLRDLVAANGLMSIHWTQKVKLFYAA